MARFHGFGRRPALLMLGLVATLTLGSCTRHGPTGEQAEVAHSFEAWKSAVINQQTDQALAYIPRHVDDYLVVLNNPPAPAAISTPATVSAPPAPAPASASPGVDLLLRTALNEKVPADLRPHLTLNTLLQRITEKHVFNTRDVKQITLGRVSVTGDHASAEVYYEGALTALRLPFIKEDNVWKIDVMAVLPYAEVLMRLDRAVKGETETQQVNQLVAKLPSL